MPSTPFGTEQFGERLNRKFRCGAAALLAAALAVSSALAEPVSYDELPEGAPEDLAPLYFSALALPGVGGWDPGRRAALLDAATLRYRDRLVNRATAPTGVAAQRHVERLAASGAAAEGAVAQACAQFGLVGGACAAHAGYVRRVLVLEEMLVQGQVGLGDLEAELVGASRPGLDAGRSE